MDDGMKLVLHQGPQAKVFLDETKSSRFNELLESSIDSRNSHDYRNQTMLSIKNLADFTKERTALKVIGTPNLNTTKTIKTESTLSRITSNTRQSTISKRGVSQTDKKQRSRSGVEDCVSSPTSPTSSIRVRTNVFSA